MQISTLIENHPHPAQASLEAEHGLSFIVEVNGHVYLSDVGQSGKFADNARKMGLALAGVEALVISHHHYDHGGGLERFFEENDQALVYLRQASGEDYVVDSPPDPLRYIGLDQGLLREHQARIEMISENQEAAPGLHLLTNIPDRYPKPDGDLRLQMLSDGDLQPDAFQHELVTVVEGEDGLVVLTGCGHNGVLNMLEAVHQAFHEREIQAVIGGFHLHHEDPEAVLMVAETLLEAEIPVVVSGHCTGQKAVKLLEDCLGDRFQRLHTGMVMEF